MKVKTQIQAGPKPGGDGPVIPYGDDTPPPIPFPG